MTTSSSRLDKIEAQLTPQQAVIRFMDDAHRIPSFDEWLCARLQEGGHTLRRLADRVEETVRSNMRAEGRGRDGQQLTDRAVRRTRQDVAFLYHLHWNVNQLAAAQSQTHALQRARLWEQLRGILVLEFVWFDLARVRHFLADEVPYPLDPETAAAVLARVDHDIAPWDYLQDCIEEWVYAWYVDQGKTTLPSGVYSHHQLDAKVGRPDEVEIRSAFAEADAYTEWKEGRDYQYGLTDVRDADYRRVCDQVEQAIRDLIRAGTVKRGTAVRLETVPHDFLQFAPLVDNEWIDRYVVELAEWGARLDERGLRQTSDGDTHHLAWMRIMQDGREADAELVTANREEARASVATFPGRPKEINGRVYLHIDDYRSWPERRVLGDIPLAGPDGEGVVEASWNAWIDANGRAPTPEESRWAGRRQDGKVAELSGVPVDSLWSYIRRSDFLIMDDPNELARWQKARQDTVDSLNQWTQSEGIDEGERRRWPDDVTSVRTRIADWKASAWGYIADVFVTEAVADAISNRYFDGHPVLFAKEAEDLKDTIAVMENMVQLYNETVARLSEPDYCIDLDEVRRTAEPMIRKAIRYAVEAAKGDALRNFGEDDAANEILLSHLLEGSEKENS